LGGKKGAERAVGVPGKDGKATAKKISKGAAGGGHERKGSLMGISTLRNVV